MEILFINALMHIVILIYAWKKYGFGLYTFLWMYYSLFSVLGIIVVLNGVYFNEVKTLNKELSIIPYIINFVCLYLLLLPLRKISINKIEIPSIQYLDKLRPIVRVLFFFYAIYLVERLYELSLMSSLSMVERYEMIAGEGELVTNNVALIIIRRICGLVYFSTFPFSMFYILCYIIKKQQTKIRLKHPYGLLLLCMLPYVVICMVSANRSQLYFLALRGFFFLFLFFQYFSAKAKRRIISISILCAVSIIYIALAISISRFETTSSSPFESILRYFGETYPNLGYVYWNRVTNHPMGLNLYPNLYAFLTGNSLSDTGAGFFEKYSFWESFTGVPVLYFKSIFASLYIEFGTIGAVLIILFIYKMMNAYVRCNNNLTFLSVPIIYYYFIVCCKSVIGYPFPLKELQILCATICFLFIINRQFKLKRIINTNRI